MKSTIITIAIIIYIFGIGVGIIAYHYIIIDKTIDRRASALGMMVYSAEKNKMIPKDEYRWMLKYLKDGTMK